MKTRRAASASSPYILSPRLDMLLIVGAVLLCPAILLPLSHATSPHTVWLLVMSFGAVGHHLPSFLRTYGDRDLFKRWKWRLIAAPVLVFAVTLWFSLRGLHGVLLLSFCWSIWHGMMQHFGFLRIYDAKVGSVSEQTARLDWWISASWFAMCLALSPNLGSSLLNGLYDSGVPILPLAWIGIVRNGVITATVVVTAIYIAHAIRGKQPRSWMKLGLLAGTFGYVWIARVVTPNPYLSVALFELLHDVQYLAIVWAFNRRLVEKGNAGVLPRFFYRARAWSVAGYVGACLAYGAIALTVLTQLEAGLLKQVLEAALISSGLLHYYYDSFIWKLKQPDTRQGLGLESVTVSRRDWSGLAQPVLVAVLIVVLARFELYRGTSDLLGQTRAVAEAVPNSSVALGNYGTQLLRRTRTEEAVPFLRRALAIDGEMKEAKSSLSEALALLAQDELQAGRINDALALVRESLQLDPLSPDRHNSIAVLLAQLGNYRDAEASLRRALELDPDFTQARVNLEALRQVLSTR